MKLAAVVSIAAVCLPAHRAYAAEKHSVRIVRDVPYLHVHDRVPPMLILYADRDDQWRRDQNAEMEKALRAARNARVVIAQIQGLTHNSIRSQMGKDDDEVASRIVAFVRGTSAKSSAR
jgi:hypothetical protein